MPPTPPPNSETVVISFLCGSLALSFLLAVIGALVKVYRPFAPMSARIREFLANMRSTPPPEQQQAPVPPREVQLVDVGFDFGLRGGGSIAYPIPIAVVI